MDSNYFDLWKALDAKFDIKKYLYHYTNFTKTVEILYSEKLRFSPLTKMNDTSEYKARLSVDLSSVDKSLKVDAYKKLGEITQYINSSAKYIRLICFSRDEKINKNDAINLPHWQAYDRFLDQTGRGYALPRMWAQYASNNEGVCLIFDKSKLLNAVKNKAPYYKLASVEYKNYFYRYTMKYEELCEIYSKISQEATGMLPIASLFELNKNFTRYNYFVKLKDWQNEKEFRILTLVSNDNEFYIDNLYDYLVGIVVGEKINPAFKDALKNQIKNKNIDLKEIAFDTHICQIKE